jgi:8-oxo-dGTP pyrophosphatase MutT (NUDIX family)
MQHVSVPVSWLAVQLRLRRLLATPTNFYHPLRVDGQAAGWITPERCDRLRGFADVFRVGTDAVEFVPAIGDAATRTSALAEVTAQLAAENRLTAWRNENYAVAPALSEPPWFLLERAAARFFGVHTYAVHANGLVANSGDVHMWIARRSRDKAIDPGMLDNLVGGGVAAGSSAASTLAKEAWEEAGMPPALVQAAIACGSLGIRRDQPDGLQWETIFVNDIWVPADFAPDNQDGEAIEHRLVRLAEAAELIACDAGADQVTADASLVILDCLLRNAAIAADAALLAELRALGAPPG